MCGLDALTYAVWRNAVESGPGVLVEPDCAPIRTPIATATIAAAMTAACPARFIDCLPYFFGGVTGAGLANRDASTVPLARICVSSNVSRPSRPVCVYLNGIFTPFTSR